MTGKLIVRTVPMFVFLKNEQRRLLRVVYEGRELEKIRCLADLLTGAGDPAKTYGPEIVKELKGEALDPITAEARRVRNDAVANVESKYDLLSKGVVEAMRRDMNRTEVRYREIAEKALKEFYEKKSAARETDEAD